MAETTREIMAMAVWGTAADTGSTGRINSGSEPRDWDKVLVALGNAMEEADPRERARLRHRVGHVALLLGDVRPKAIEAFTLMQEEARALGDRLLLGLALCGLSAAYDHIGQRHLALQYAQEAQPLAEALGDQRLLALALAMEAQFYKENGQNERANELFIQIGEIGGALGDERLELAALIGRGRTTSMARAFSAIDSYEQALAMARQQGDDHSAAVCLNNLSDWKINTGAYAEAIALREEALRLARQLGARDIVGRALIGMAKAYTLQDDLAKARELLDRGLPMVLSSADLEGELHSSLNLAYLYVRQGDIPRACELYRQVLERSLAAPDHACAVFAQRALELLAEGDLPKPAILPPQPARRELLAALESGETSDELSEEELDLVVGGVGATYNYTYPTGDLAWRGSTVFTS